ncbi:MAG: poly-gamma-glutamate biosynthesis protein PgsC [Deferribacteraceae bacterium]|jgi:poly-gamma-glutamate biosynthesis protein PgsC/CapC|nr:poly-gamma-glutamate biosynthesis protein PgsC [Deferribacteraceae bacterium]
MPEIILGIVIALFVYEATGFSPGGIITAGYIALFISHWQFNLATLAMALLTVLMVKFLSKHMVLYGKRLFAVYLFTGLVLSQLIPQVLNSATTDFDISTIGYVLPGLIAKDMGGQGIVPTIGALVLTVGLVKIAVFAIV